MTSFGDNLFCKNIKGGGVFGEITLNGDLRGDSAYLNGDLIVEGNTDVVDVRSTGVVTCLILSCNTFSAAGLPTTDPGEAGQFWAATSGDDAGFVRVSLGAP